MTLHVISCIKTFRQDQVKKVFITFFSCKIPCDQLLMLVYQKIDARGRWVGGGGGYLGKQKRASNLFKLVLNGFFLIFQKFFD